MNEKMISIVVLTYNRKDEIKRNLSELKKINYSPLEIIVVDNCSEIPVRSFIDDETINIVRMPQNLGVAGRNEGVKVARGEIVVTLDDDVFGFNDQAITELNRIFQDSTIGAVNFKVIDDLTENQVNWCHKRKVEEYGDQTFDTVEISEGAIAFRREAITEAGLYPEYFFISHEGPDLALRIMNLGYRVIYYPKIVVRHSHAVAGRPGWRRYYYDTRNQIWLLARLFPISIGWRKAIIGLGSMFVYAIRDGYFLYWVKGVRDGLGGVRRAYKDRTSIDEETWRRYKAIQKHNAGFLYMVKKRIFRRSVRI